MLQFILYAFPVMVLLIGAYLLIYQNTLKNVLKIETAKPILAFAVTYIILSILGFFILFYQLKVVTIIWILVVLTFTSIMTFLFFKIYDINHKD
ncbi:hypothetical protein HZY86_02980 [Aerococcaceae bacterium DSM 111020]|nr:hypothetical protein [Aerococcaceae bacterium DSM 111020]